MQSQHCACACACVCVCNDRPKSNKEDPGAPFGQHHRDGLALAMKKLRLKTQGDGARGKAEGGMRNETDAAVCVPYKDRGVCEKSQQLSV